MMTLIRMFTLLAIAGGMCLPASLIAQQTPNPGTVQERPRNPNTLPLPEKNPEGQPVQPQPSSTPSAPSDQTSSEQSASPAPASRMFLGTIISVNERLMLKETASGTNYGLDDQSKAKPYQGEKVLVTGSLDAGNMIHIQTIKPAT